MRVRAHMQKIDYTILYIGSADVSSAKFARKEGGRILTRSEGDEHCKQTIDKKFTVYIIFACFIHLKVGFKTFIS